MCFFYGIDIIGDFLHLRILNSWSHSPFGQSIGKSVLLLCVGLRLLCMFWCAVSPIFVWEVLRHVGHLRCLRSPLGDCCVSWYLSIRCEIVPISFSPGSIPHLLLVRACFGSILMIFFERRAFLFMSIGVVY